MISLFANIFVSDFRNFKTAIRSFDSLPIEIFDETIINIRGSYSISLKKILLRILERKKYINKASIFTFDTKTSWKIDSLMLLELIEGDFIFTWIEDHICINQELFRQAIKFCKENNVDSFCYSFHDWNYRAESYEFLETNHSKNFLYCDLGLAARKSINFDYDHSLVSIQKKELLEYIWSLPVQRFDYRLTPLEAEISPGKLLKKTIRKGFFKDKFFASVDDDHLVVGSSLISQKRYPPYPRVTNFFSETRDKRKRLKKFFKRKIISTLNQILSMSTIKQILNYKCSFFELELNTLMIHLSRNWSARPKSRDNSLPKSVPGPLQNTMVFKIVADDLFLQKLGKYQE